MWHKRGNFFERACLEVETESSGFSVNRKRCGSETSASGSRNPAFGVGCRCLILKALIVCYRHRLVLDLITPSSIFEVLASFACRSRATMFPSRSRVASAGGGQ